MVSTQLLVALNHIAVLIPPTTPQNNLSKNHSITCINSCSRTLCLAPLHDTEDDNNCLAFQSPRSHHSQSWTRSYWCVHAYREISDDRQTPR